jgi:nucleoside-diphosphate-sugar epimerase
MNERVLVSGASGFVGSALVARLAHDARLAVRAAVRRANWRAPPDVEVANVADLAAGTDWRAALQGVQYVVHAAARVHVMQDRAADPLLEYRCSNVEGTLALARQAAALGVRRFIFISSIKVNGETTAAGKPFRAADTPRPADPYGVSKLEGEAGLKEIAASTGMQLVIVRPPLVYGPGVGANFRKLMQWLHAGKPLPFGAIDNRRSLIGIDNLVDLIALTLEHPAAPGQVLLASDDEDVSTTSLMRSLGLKLRRPARLLPVPAAVLRLGAALVGKSAAISRLCDSLQLDVSATRSMLRWSPPVDLDEGLTRTVKGFLSETRL